MHNLDADGDASVDQSLRNVVCAVAFGEDAQPALDLGFNAERFEKCDGVLLRKARNCAHHKPRIRDHVVQKLLARAGVGEVAPALAGNIQFSAATVVFLKQKHVISVYRGVVGGEKPCRTSADNYTIIHRCHKLRFLPRFVRELRIGWRFFRDRVCLFPE